MTIVVKPDSYYERSYSDTETGRRYRRLVAGLGWPTGMRPGFALVLAEIYEPDYTKAGKPRHIYLLDEIESGKMEELTRLTTAMLKEHHDPVLCTDDADPLYFQSQRNPSCTPLYGRLPVRTDILTMGFVKQLVTNRGQFETLHFPEGAKIGGRLLEIQDPDLPLKDYPAVFALGCALCELEINNPGEPDDFEEEPDASGPSGRSEIGGY
jgi:hypothetical protein